MFFKCSPTFHASYRMAYSMHMDTLGDTFGQPSLATTLTAGSSLRILRLSTPGSWSAGNAGVHGIYRRYTIRRGKVLLTHFLMKHRAQSGKIYMETAQIFLYIFDTGNYSGGPCLKQISNGIPGGQQNMELEKSSALSLHIILIF